MSNESARSGETRISTDSTELSWHVFDQGVEKSLRLLQQISDEFHADGSVIATHYKQRLDGVRTLDTQVHATIGVIGATGVGKSKCINALLEQNLLPTSDSGACTAAPIEIVYNDSKVPNKSFLAEIQFITQEQWAEELKLLIKDISSDTTKTDWNSIKHDSSDSPAKRAFDKIQAVYPYITDLRPDQVKYDDLLSDTVKRLLGSKLLFESDVLAHFRQQLDPYIGCQTGMADERVSQYWPLIAKIQISSRASILESGVRLVDLPGMYDSNTARAIVAEQYLDKCSSVLVMTEISRAKDSKLAMDFLKGSSARQLRLNGTLHHVAFVCTKTDADLTRFNSDNMNQLPKALHVLREKIKEMARLSSQRDQLEDDGRDPKMGRQRFGKRRGNCTVSKKRKSAAAVVVPVQRKLRAISSRSSVGIEREGRIIAIPIEDDDSNSGGDQGVRRLTPHRHDHVQHESLNTEPSQANETDLSSSERELRFHELETGIESISSEIRQKQVIYRNQECKKEIQKHFGDFLTAELIDVGQKEDGLKVCTTSVFCVSSESYMHLRSRDRNAWRIAAQAGFSNEEDTEIPALRQHCVRFAFDTKLRSYAKFFNGMHDIVNSLKLYASDGTGTGEFMEATLRQLESRLKELLDSFEMDLGKSVISITTLTKFKIKDHIHDMLQRTKSEAITQSGHISGEWDRIHGTTFAAIIRHGGKWKNRYCDYDLNADLMRSFANPLDKIWTTFFLDTIPQDFGKAASECINLVREVDCNVHQILQGMGASTQTLELLASQSIVTADKIRLNFEDAQQSIMAGKTYRRKICQTIEEQMVGAYAQAAMEAGPGRSQRMRKLITIHLLDIRTSMFEHAVTIVQQSLSDLLVSSTQTLRHAMYTLAANHTIDHSSFVTSSRSKARATMISHSTAIHPLVYDFERNVLEKLLIQLQDHANANSGHIEVSSGESSDER